MKFICTQQNLTQGLSITERVVIKNFTLPILQNILITCDTGKNMIKFSATDLEVGVEVFIPGKVEEGGAITIPAKLFTDFIKNLPQKNIIILEKNKTITITCENYKSQIKGESAKEYPLIPATPNDQWFQVKNADFSSGISSVIYAVSLLDIKPEICGVYTQFKEDNTCFVATDSFRLSEKSIFQTEKSSTLQSVILPRKTCDLVTKIFQSGEDVISIQINSGQIIFLNNPKEAFSLKIRVVSRIIEGDYPAYEQIIPQKFMISVEASKDELAHHIKTASLFTSKVNEVTLVINLKKQLLEISSSNQEYGEHHSTISCVVRGGDERIAFNAQYIIDGIQNIAGERVRMQANTSTSPVLFSSLEDNGFRYVVMPIKAS